MQLPMSLPALPFQALTHQLRHCLVGSGPYLVRRPLPGLVFALEVRRGAVRCIGVHCALLGLERSHHFFLLADKRGFLTHTPFAYCFIFPLNVEHPFDCFM